MYAEFFNLRKKADFVIYYMGGFAKRKMINNTYGWTYGWTKMCISIYFRVDGWT